MTPEQRERDEMAQLLAISGFRKFLWRAIQSARILTPATDGSDGRNLAYCEGLRNLGFEILADAARGQPVDDPEAAFNLTLFQILREESQQPPKESHRGRRFDRNDDLRTDADGDEPE